MMSDKYLSDWAQILLFLLGGLAFIMITLLASRILRPHHPNEQKLTTYESGEAPQGNPWVQFNIRFYIIALIFLLFEVEIIFLFPWATIFAKEDLLQQTHGSWGWFAFIEMIVFILILVIGLAYAWVNGFLDWLKPQVKSEVFKSPVPKEHYDRINERYRKK